MDMFGEFQLKITPGSVKTLTPIFVKIPKNGVSQDDEFFTSSAFFTKKCIFTQKYIPRG